MLGNNWEASERDLKDRCEKARKDLSEKQIELDTLNHLVNEKRKILQEFETMTYDQVADLSQVTQGIMGAVQDYRVNTDIVLHLKQENAAMEEKMGILKNEVTKNKDIIDNLRFDIEKTEKLLSLMYINNSNLRIENQKQIGEIEDRKKEMQKIEKEYKDREEKIKEKEEYIHARQIDQEVIQRRLNLTEKRLNNLKEELLFNKT